MKIFSSLSLSLSLLIFLISGFEAGVAQSKAGVGQNGAHQIQCLFDRDCPQSQACYRGINRVCYVTSKPCKSGKDCFDGTGPKFTCDRMPGTGTCEIFFSVVSCTKDEDCAGKGKEGNSECSHHGNDIREENYNRGQGTWNEDARIGKFGSCSPSDPDPDGVRIWCKSDKDCENPRCNLKSPPGFCSANTSPKKACKDDLDCNLQGEDDRYACSYYGVCGPVANWGNVYKLTDSILGSSSSASSSSSSSSN